MGQGVVVPAGLVKETRWSFGAAFTAAGIATKVKWSEAVCARDEGACYTPRTTGRGNHEEEDKIDSAKVKDGDASSAQQAATIQIMFNKVFLNATVGS